MDKDHLVELITTSIFNDDLNIRSDKSYIAMKNYLERLNLDQLRTMSKEFILQKYEIFKFKINKNIKNLW